MNVFLFPSWHYCSLSFFQTFVYKIYTKCAVDMQFETYGPQTPSTTLSKSKERKQRKKKGSSGGWMKLMATMCSICWCCIFPPGSVGWAWPGERNETWTGGFIREQMVSTSHLGRRKAMQESGQLWSNLEKLCRTGNF